MYETCLRLSICVGLNCCKYPLNVDIFTFITERIRMGHEVGDGVIFNNTVINHFRIPAHRREAPDSDSVYEAPLDVGVVDGILFVLCSGTQGDHQVSWSTNNSVVGNSDGTVNCDWFRRNRQQIFSNYSSR